MTLPSWTDKLLLTFKRDLLLSLRHRKGFFVQAVSVLAQLLGAYYLARSIGPSFRPDGMSYFPFLLIGTAFSTFVVTSVGSFVSAIEQAQTTGTIEVVMSTATKPRTMVLLSAISAFAGSGAGMVAYLLAGALFAGSAFHINVAAAAVVFLLSVLVALALGVIAASVQLWMQKGSAVTWLFATLSWLMSGTAFPVSVFPAPLRHLTELIPLTHSLRGLRMTMLEGAGLHAVRGPVLILCAFTALLLPLSLAVFSRVGRAARMEGSLSFY